jgi:hypothetical protein
MAVRAPAALLAALALAGCGTGADEQIAGGGQLGGHTLTVYSLTRDPYGATRDFVAGEKLALQQAHGKVGSLLVNFAAFDLGATRASAALATQRAIEDPQIIAAVADATPVTVPLLNAAGVLQVTPGGDPRLRRDPDLNPSGHQTAHAPLADAFVAGLPGFDTPFRRTYGRAPTGAARGGYLAMRGVLAAIARAGRRGNDRTQVVRAY